MVIPRRRAGRVRSILLRFLGLLLLIGGGSAYFWLPGYRLDPVRQARDAYARGDWQQAWTIARDYLRTRPNDADALRLLARAGGRLGRTDSTRTIYKERVGTENMEAEDYYVLSRGFLAENQVDRAITVMEAGLASDPRHPELLQELARLYAQQDDLLKATRLAERLATIPGLEARGELLVGVLKAEQSDPAGTAEHLSRALERDPLLKEAPTTPAKARKLLARSELQLGRQERARNALKPVLDAGADPEASWLLSRAHLQAGELTSALAALEDSKGFGGETLYDREPSPYVGSARCAECHQAIHQSQQSSLHARTFYTTAKLEQVALPPAPIVDPEDSRVVHTFKRNAQGTRVETVLGDETFQAVLDYALGSGDRGLTFIGHDAKGTLREIRLSRYNGGALWDRTVGQNPHPTNHDQFLGLPISTDEVHACVNCHTTDGRAAREGLGAVATDHGIGCERCHGPGGNHVKAVDVKFPDMAIVRPQDYTAPRVLRLCGQCHSPRGNVAINSGSPATVRFQVVTFAKSRCYTESSGGFSCTTCHNPHRNAETNASFYESKCLSCHGTPSGTPKSEKTRTVASTACPINPGRDCLKCHMPSVTDAAPHSIFTDHFIRVHEETTAVH